MELDELLKVEIIIPLLVSVIATWFAAHYYANSSLDVKVRQARRYRRTGFGEVSNPSGQETVIERIDTPIGTFTINGDGTVTDRKNQLMWIQARWGLTWDGEKFTGEVVKLNWWDATELFGKGIQLGPPVGRLFEDHLMQSRIENGYQKGKCITTFAGYSDWHLPTAYEIDTLGFYDPSGKLEDYEFPGSKLPKTLRKRLFPNLAEANGKYWLWCANEQDVGMAWAIDGTFPPGDFAAKSQYHVLFVRSC